MAWTHALVAYINLSKLSAQPNVKKASATISACRTRWMQAVAILKNCRRIALEADTVLHSAALAACDKGARWEHGWLIARELRMNQLQEDVIACSSVTSAAARGGKWQEANLCLTEMRKHMIRPNQISVNAAISACEQAGRWNIALTALSAACRLGMRPDVVSCNTLVSSCATCAMAPWHRAVALFGGMSESWQKDIISYNAVMSTHEKGGLWLQALQLLTTVRVEGGQYDIITASASVGACARSAQWERAVAFRQELFLNSMRPNVVPFSMAVDACDAARCWQAGVALMLDASLTLRLDAIIINPALKVRSSWQQSWTVLANSKRCALQADMAMTSTVISVAASDSIWQRAFPLFRGFYSSRLTDLTLYNSVISVCQSVCLWVHVIQLFAAMQCELQPDILTVSSLLHACDYGRRGWQVQVLLAKLSCAGIETCRRRLSAGTKCDSVEPLFLV